MAQERRGQVVGVIGGAFNPVHLGHVLLAVTVKETKPVDEVVMVPVFKHPVKTDLLPFEDRVAMCRLAVEGKGIGVSTVEQETGESNIAMLRALRARYSAGVELWWVCGDDVFEWIDNPKGQAMMCELDGLIVQRRLHQTGGGDDSFYKSPVDMARIRALMEKHNVKIDMIFGELPHFSSTLVRSSPASWKAYLPQCVALYLDERPHLLAQLVRSSGGEPPSDEPVCKRPKISEEEKAAQLQETITSCVMRGVAVLHGLQKERGRSAVALSLRDKKAVADMQEARTELDQLLRGVPSVPAETGEVHSLAQELAYAPSWLGRDRAMLDQYLASTINEPQSERDATGWLRRVEVIRKYNCRTDVVLEGCMQVLRSQVAMAPKREAAEKENGVAHPRWTLEPLIEETGPEIMLQLFRLWSRGKEALGRERAFVCAGGHQARELIRHSLQARSRLGEVVEQKEIFLKRILEVEATRNSMGSLFSASNGCSEALQAMLTRISAWEWSLMRCFSASTPLSVLHQTLASEDVCTIGVGKNGLFDTEGWYNTTSSAVDLMLTLVQGLAAGISASVAERPSS